MLNRWAFLFVKLVLTGAAIWYLQKTVDLRAAFAVGRSLTPEVAVAALALLAVHVLIGAARWAVVAEAIGGPLPIQQAFVLSCVGNFFSQFLPGGVGGDVIRMWKANRGGVPLRVAVNSVALDRVVTLFGLVLLVAVTQPLLVNRAGTNLGTGIFPILTIAGLAGVIVLASLDRMPTFLQRFHIVRGFASLAADSRRVFFTPRFAIPALALTLLAHVNLTLVAWVLGLGLGADVSALDCIVLFPQVFLAAILPISIGGWGVRETAMVVIFGAVGVSAVHATAISVIFGVLVIIVALPGGLFWVLSTDRAP